MSVDLLDITIFLLPIISIGPYFIVQILSYSDNIIRIVIIIIIIIIICSCQMQRKSY